MTWIRRLRLSLRLAGSLVGWLAILAMIPACGDEFATEAEPQRCEGDASLACNEDPWICPQGQNCWTDSSNLFTCFNAGAGEPEGSCQPLAGASTCVADYGCVALSAQTPGTCRAYCDPQDPCKACGEGFNCTPLTFGTSATISFCLPG